MAEIEPCVYGQILKDFIPSAEVLRTEVQALTDEGNNACAKLARISYQRPSQYK